MAGATPRLWGGLAWMEKAAICLGSRNQRPKRRSPDPLGNTIHVWLGCRQAWGGRPDGGDQRGGGQRVITFYTEARASDEDACIGGYLALS